ncbi:hypothetical protein EB118_03955 [bacterium]|nr:hypothetical protein [Actinomycetota bacterium]NDG29240.1 hypothetical protein [bacterium]
MDTIEDWLYTRVDGTTYHDEIKSLFFEIESMLLKKDLLRPDYKKYRTLHFSTFCRDIFEAS